MTKSIKIKNAGDKTEGEPSIEIVRIINRINKKLDEMSNRLDKLIEVIKNE